jgi:hypothetical protein
VSAAGYGITVAGDWSNPNGASGFIQRNGTVSFTDSGRTTTLSGNTTFHHLACVTPGKTITGTAGSVQTLEAGGVLTLAGGSTSPIVLNSTGSVWTLSNTDSQTTTVSYVSVTDVIAGAAGITAAYSSGSGTTTNWTFAGGVYTWNGSASSSWRNENNWTPVYGTPGSGPVAGDAVVIPTRAPRRTTRSSPWPRKSPTSP